MKYMLLIYGDERVWASMPADGMKAIYAAHRDYGEALQKSGAMVSGAELQPVTTATSIRFDKGRTQTIDGPFAETKEQLGGYYIIDVPNLDEALEWARKMPGMTQGTIEVRPLAES